MEHCAISSPLLSLPAELRERIYSLTLADITGTSISTHPREPALLTVSKTIRCEALPLFYSNLTLLIQTYIKVDIYGNTRITYKPDCRLVPVEALKYIKTFRLCYGLIQRYTGELVPLEFQVHLNKRDGIFTLGHSFDRKWIKSPARSGDPADFEDIVAVLRDHITTVFREVVERPGTGRFRAYDLERLLKIDADSLPV